MPAEHAEGMEEQEDCAAIVVVVADGHAFAFVAPTVST